jgi:co-chaperonin GroES (HSP10)
MKNVSYAEKEYAKLSPVGNFVLLEKLEQEAIRKVDGIYIPESEHYTNAKMGCGKVLELKEELSEEYGVKAGDYVLYDFYSAHGDHKDTVITDVDNLIVVLTEEEADKFVKGEQ